MINQCIATIGVYESPLGKVDIWWPKLSAYPHRLCPRVSQDRCSTEIKPDHLPSPERPPLPFLRGGLRTISLAATSLQNLCIKILPGAHCPSPDVPLWGHGLMFSFRRNSLLWMPAALPPQGTSMFVLRLWLSLNLSTPSHVCTLFKSTICIWFNARAQHHVWQVTGVWWVFDKCMKPSASSSKQ